jgi:hypothetical protein
MTGARGGVVVLLLGLASGCSHAPPDATPEGAVKLFLDDMEQASDDPRLMRAAYGLLGPAARANLEERARRTSRLQGRQAQPWEMLAAGRFGLAFRPKAYRPTRVGDRASVEVFGAAPQAEHASVPCVQEAGGWRVEPGLPEP